MGIVANSTTVSLLQVANAFMRVCNSNTITSTGSGTIVVPSYARGVVVIGTAAGGGGNTVWGGGGGGTLYIHRLVESGQTISYSVGTGGPAGSGSAAGTNGGNTNVTIGAVTVEAKGGIGGGASGVAYAEGDIWNTINPFDGYDGSYPKESNSGKPGEFDGTQGEPGLMQEDLGIGSYGYGGAGNPTGYAGQNGGIIFKWLSCPIQTDVYTGGQSGTATAPADADFVIIKAWGGGGGGRNNPGPAGGSHGGGGGGGFVIKRMPVTGGSTSFTYSVGSGGAAAAAGGNTTISGGATIDAGGGGGGQVSAGGAGGIAVGGDSDSEAGTSGLSGGGLGVPGLPGRWNEVNDKDRHYYQPYTWYSGLQVINAGVYTSEPTWDVVTNSGTPGQGGSGDFEGTGDPGANGEIRFEWFTSKPRLSKFRANATITTGFDEKAVVPTTPNNAAGYNGMIVESGNIDLLDFRDATFATHQDDISLYTSRAYRVTYASASADAKAKLYFANTGYMVLSEAATEAPDGDAQFTTPVAWLLKSANATSVLTTDEFDVRVTKTGGADGIEGLANNTWYNVNTTNGRLEWYLTALASSPSSPPGGTASATCNVTVDIRRTDTDAIVDTFNVRLIAQADSNSGPPP